MRLTIIPSDGTVSVDGVSVSGLVLLGIPEDVHALQWDNVSGWVELKNNTGPNPAIYVLPEWADEAVVAWEVATTPVPPVPPTAEENKATAAMLLSDTDWTTIPDVSDPAVSNPYLKNVGEYVYYRNLLREIAVNPVAGDIVWPSKPKSIWGTV